MNDFSKDSALVYIDNKSLDGFLEGLQKHKCSTTNCKQCSYCNEWANKVVVYNLGQRAEILKAGKDLDDGLIGGGLW